MPEFALKPLQDEILHDPTRYRVVVAGRRSGKTFGECLELYLAAAGKPDARAWYVAPTYRMARDIAWPTLKAIVDPAHLAKRPNESQLSLTLYHGAEIALKGADDPDRLRGPGLDFCAFDEFAWIDPYAWDVLRPALADRQGRALFTTTPAGFNWAYDFFLRGQDAEREDWRSWQFTTADAGIVPVEEIEAARADLDPRIFRQEYEASFETLQGRVYSNFERGLHVDPNVEDTGGEILIGQDFNVHPMSGVIAVRVADECHVLDAIEIPDSNTEVVAAEYRQRYPNRKIAVCPDPSGRARKSSAPVGQTDFTIMQRAGFDVRAPSKAPPVVDRINNTQAMLVNADGRPRIKIHPRALPLIRALEGLTYKEGTSQVDKKLGLDHVCDAFDYLLWQEFNTLRRPVVVTTYEI